MIAFSKDGGILCWMWLSFYYLVVLRMWDEEGLKE